MYKITATTADHSHTIFETTKRQAMKMARKMTLAAKTTYGVTMTQVPTLDEAAWVGGPLMITVRAD